MREDASQTAKILIVDDEPANVLVLERLLRQTGYTNLRSTTDARKVLPLFAEIQPDLVLLDLWMPHRDGFSLLEDLALAIPQGSYVPVLVLTADVTPDALRRALLRGAKDFLTKPFDTQEVLLRIRNLLETRFLHLAVQRQNQVLEERVQERTQQLLQAEKLSAMGQLLAGVAHELNNPLAVVMGQAMLLRETGRNVEERTQQIEKAAERCVRIVRNFLALARQHPPERAEVDLNAVADGALELLAYELKSDSIEVCRAFAPDIPPFWADPHQLHQVLVNLIANAYHAMRPSAPPRRLTIATRVVPEPPRARLEVTDTGPGIPPEIRQRIFEPFFTTKPVGQGTGLGLPLCAGIVEEHGGTLTVASVPGEGATFAIELPLVAMGASAARPDEGRAEPPRVGGRRVLVVDDEAPIAALLAEVLRTEGHEVDTAANGAEALARLATVAYDLILSDTKMPVLDGPGFFQQLERWHPAMCRRVIFVTGDVLNPEKREFFERTGAPTITKPFNVDEVRRVVRTLLSGSAVPTRALP